MGKIFLCIASAIVFYSGFGYANAEENSGVDLEKIVVTPARMEQLDYKSASNVTVISGEDIASSGARNASDVLEQKAGVNIYSNSSDKTVKVDIRGFADTAVSNVLVLVDGRKVNSIDISGADWLQIPVEAIDRIEVIRGAGSVLYGDNAVGGVVNIITKKGKGKLSGKAGTMVGSYGTRQDDIEIQGADKDISYYLCSKYFETDGYRANSNLLAKDMNARIDFGAAEFLSVGFSAGWHKDDYGMPGGLDDQSELDRYGRRGSADALDFASTKDRFVKISIDSDPKLSGMDLGKIAIDSFYRNRDAYSWFYYGGWPTATKYKIDTRGLTFKNIQNRNIADKEFNLVTGIDYYDIKHTIRGSEYNSDDLTIYKDEIGFYGYSEYELFRDLFLNGGARYQRAKYRFDQQKSSPLYTTRTPSETVFIGGAKYEYAKGSNVRFNIQENFRFLATDEWYSTWTGLNTNLKQQTGIQYEMGIKHNIDDALMLEMTPYVIDIDNEIYVNPAVYPGNNENYPKTRRKGVELSMDSDLFKFRSSPYLDKLWVFANYTYEQPKFRGGEYDDNDIPMVPRHKANAGLNMDFLKNYEVSLIGKFVGDSYAANDAKNELSKVKNHVTLDARAAYKKSLFEVYCGISNIFDEKYYDYVVRATGASTKKDYYPAPERSFEMGAIYKW